jgi:hypothetical protein
VKAPPLDTAVVMADVATFTVVSATFPPSDEVIPLWR